MKFNLNFGIGATGWIGAGRGVEQSRVTKQAPPGETVLGMPQPIFSSDFLLMFGMWVMCLKFNLNFGIGGDVIVEFVHGAVGSALDGVEGECATKENQITPKKHSSDCYRTAKTVQVQPRPDSHRRL